MVVVAETDIPGQIPGKTASIEELFVVVARSDSRCLSGSCRWCVPDDASVPSTDSVSLGKSWKFRGINGEELFRIIDGDCEIQILSALEIQGRDSDHLSRHVEQRTAAATGRDRRRDSARTCRLLP